MKTGWKITFAILSAFIASLLITMFVTLRNGTCIFCGKRDAVVRMSILNIGDGNTLNACEECSREMVMRKMSDNIAK